jgi:RHS repeat-associated protein
LLFAGYYRDPETGLYHVRNRTLHAQLGRWLERDPIGYDAGDTNLYAYVANRPTVFVDPAGLDVGDPGWWSLVPVVGSAWEAAHDFECGRWVWGIINTGLAISDVFLVGSLAKGVGKGAFKVGSHKWGATRKWLRRQGRARPHQPAHHWLGPRRLYEDSASGIGATVFNQPWNLHLLTPPRWLVEKHGYKLASIHWHNALHGESKHLSLNIGQKLWHGTPHWAKATVASTSGHAVNVARPEGKCDCD